jgi:hypothetical protein
MRIVAILVMIGLAIGAVLAPDLLLQVVFRGGFLIGGVAIALAMKPANEVDERAALPKATRLVRART